MVELIVSYRLVYYSYIAISNWFKLTTCFLPFYCHLCYLNFLRFEFFIHLVRLVSTTHFNSKAMPTNNTDLVAI